MTRAFNAWFGSLLAIAIFTPISVLWLDKPIALFVHDALGRQILGGGVASVPILSIPLLSGFVFIVCGLAAMLGREFSKLETAVLLCDVSTLAAETIKNELKFAFGRTWPESWQPNIQSFIRDDVYGFHFFQFGKSFESFPSGHAAVVAAVMSVLWILFPKAPSLMLSMRCRSRCRTRRTESPFFKRRHCRDFRRCLDGNIHYCCMADESTSVGVSAHETDWMSRTRQDFCVVVACRTRPQSITLNHFPISSCSELAGCRARPLKEAPGCMDQALVNGPTYNPVMTVARISPNTGIRKAPFRHDDPQSRHVWRGARRPDDRRSCTSRFGRSRFSLTPDGSTSTLPLRHGSSVSSIVPASKQCRWVSRLPPAAISCIIANTAIRRTDF